MTKSELAAIQSATLAGQLLGSLRSAKKSAAGRRNMAKANEARKEQDASRSWKERKIIRIERAPGKTSYFEVLSCGHRGHLAEGPNRHYLPSAHPGSPTKRRCYECCTPRDNRGAERIAGTRNA